jgi:hypothetical protein
VVSQPLDSRAVKLNIIKLLKDGIATADAHYMKWGNLYGHEWYLDFMRKMELLLKKVV